MKNYGTLKAGTASYYLVYNFLSSHLLTKNIQTYRTIILLVVLYGSLTLREECSLRVFENSVLSKISDRNACGVLSRTPEGKRPISRHRHRCEDNTKMSLKPRGWKGVDWIHLTQVRDIK
jgi:hypothetical protein